MKREEILNMPSGREIDTLVERTFFGDTEHPTPQYQEWVTEDGSDGGSGFYCPRCGVSESEYMSVCAKRYSKNMSAAWEVEEHLYNLGQVMNVVMQRKYVVALGDVLEFDFGYESKAQMIHATPHQRSRAALLAAMEEK